MISELVEMLGYCRPAFSETEEVFIERFLHPLGVFQDEFGNVIKQVGEDPTVMWSSHTDTVHRHEGRVPILVDGNTASVHPGSKASCLGADCTTGVWIMMEMIRAEVPGLYVFHRAEEVGTQGSEWLLKHTPALLKGIQSCIAFDRYGTTSIITHQMSQRGCSEAFAKSMIAQLPGFKTDDGGTYTDSYVYFGVVSECTNISVGYYNQHGTRETQNLSFAQQLRDWMVAFNTELLVFERDETVVEYDDWMGHGSWGYNYSNNTGTSRIQAQPQYSEEYYDQQPRPTRSLTELCRDYPDEAADLLEMYGVGVPDFLDHLDGATGYYRSVG